MSTETTKPAETPVSETSPGNGATPATAAAETAETVVGEAKPYHPDDIIAGLRAEIAGLKDKLARADDAKLRALAETDNVRKRTEREKVDTAKYAITGFARDMVTVADNFQRAVEAVPKEALAADGPVRSVLEGIAVIEREFMNALGRHGVKRQEPANQSFDPNLHQAVMEVQDASVPAGTVVQVFQPGYSIEERVLRPAMVVVAKGGARNGKPKPEATAGDGAAAVAEAPPVPE